MILTRRSLFAGTAALLAAPAIVRVSAIMPVMVERVPKKIQDAMVIVYLGGVGWEFLPYAIASTLPEPFGVLSADGRMIDLRVNPEALNDHEWADVLTPVL